jgi:hypothetical protein
MTYTSFSNIFYFVVALYMFRTVFPSIIRSLRPYIQLNLIRPDVFHFKTKYNRFPSNTFINFMKYSLGYMFRPQLGHHQALYMYRSFILQYVWGSKTVL